jgi:uncharacterized protein YfaA (DUF2138 family)
LLPRLKALEKYPAFRLQLPRGADATGWQSVDWQALPSQP